MKVFKGLLFFIALMICIGFVGRNEMLSRSQTKSSPLAFEVASIKPVKLVAGTIQGGGCRGWDTPSYHSFGPLTTGLGRCRFLATDLKNLIADVFGEDQDPYHFSISGGEGWMSDDRFEIDAKSEDGAKATRKQLLQMMQTLLVQQFHLKFHIDTKEVAGFNLVVAKGGPKWEKLSDAEPARPGLGGRGELTGQTDPARLAQIISNHIGAPVSDRTGLADRFVVNLKWSPAPTDRDWDAAGDTSGPSLFAVLQEQLGLQLIPQKTSIQIFVIDHAEKPASH